MAGDMLTAAAVAAEFRSDLIAALRVPSFLTATATGIVPAPIVPSVAFKAGDAWNPGAPGNGFTPACTMCYKYENEKKNGKRNG